MPTIFNTINYFQNVSLIAVYSKNETAIIDVDIDFEYSTDDKKKLMLAAALLKDKLHSRRWYRLVSVSSHQATR